MSTKGVNGVGAPATNDKHLDSKEDSPLRLPSNNNLHTSNISHVNQTQIIGDEENKLIQSGRKGKNYKKVSNDENKLIAVSNDTPTAMLKFEDSTDSIKRSGKSRIKSILQGKFYYFMEYASTTTFYLVLLTIIFLDEYLTYNYDFGTWYAIQVLIAVELALVFYFFVDLGLKTYCHGFEENFHKSLEIGGNIVKIVTLIFLILDIIYQNMSSMSGVSVIHAISRILMIVLLTKKVLELSKSRKFRIDIVDSDYNSPITKILEIMDTVKTTIRDEVMLSKYNWAMEMISSNKLYEPLLELLEKNPNDQDGKNWITKYALGLREQVPELEKGRRSSFMVLKESRRPSFSRIKSIVIPKEVLDKLDKDIEELHFNVFEINKMSNGEEVQFILYYIFEKGNLFEKLNINTATFCAFASKLAAGYLNNPYHNCTHSADVTQTVHHIIKKCGLAELAELTSLDMAAMYIAAAIHDYDHPGTNNAYHINTRSIYALRYNDKSVLENHHVSASYQMMMDEQYNIFKNYSKEDLSKTRERLIAMVLATDMANHFSDLGKIKGRLAADFNPKEKDKHMVMELTVHASDISNPGKPFDIYKEWTFRILEEFWNQGDIEREAGLPITYLCDRYTVNVAKSQIGFIDFIVFPTFDLLHQILPKTDLSHFDLNKGKWKEQIEFYDKELAALNEKKKELQKAKEAEKEKLKQQTEEKTTPK